MKTALISILTLGAISLGAGAGLSLTETPLLSARADGSDFHFITPSSYEEYLPLEKPTGITITDAYFAVSDGVQIHVFDKGESTYYTYEHERTVAQLHFDERADALYFLDGTNRLHVLSFAQLKAGEKATDTGVVCATFTIRTDKLYYTNFAGTQTTISCAPLTDFASVTVLLEDYIMPPTLSFWNGELYYVYGEHLYRLPEGTSKGVSVAKLPSSVFSMTITEGKLFCASRDGAFFGYDLTELTATERADACTPIVYEGEGYTSVTANDTLIYAVYGDVVRCFSLETSAWTSFELGSSSTSLHRLNGASKLTLAQDKLFIADDDNDRICVYDTANGVFLSPIANTLDAPQLSSYGDTLLVTGTNDAVVYSLSEKDYGATLYTLAPEDVRGTIVGATAVYGTYYVLTDTNYCYARKQGETAWTETLRKTHFAQDLISDANGFLYTINDGEIYRFTQTEFLSSVAGEKLCSTLPDALEYAVDYTGAIYALTSETLYAYTNTNDGYVQTYSKDLKEGKVYNQPARALSFSFGADKDEAYFLFEGDYLLSSNACNLPSLDKIPTEDLTQRLFEQPTYEFSTVIIRPETLIVTFDFARLNGADVFPYTGRYWNESSQIAVKIGETTSHAVLAFRTETGDLTCFVPLSAVETASSDFTLSYDEKRTATLISDASLYAYPNLSLPTKTNLTRGECLTLVGEVNGLEYDYYKIEYTTETGVVEGYIPKSFITFVPSEPEPQTTTYGNQDEKGDSLFRLTYLCLGALAVCILGDFLLLRRREED